MKLATTHIVIILAKTMNITVLSDVSMTAPLAKKRAAWGVAWVTVARLEAPQSEWDSRPALDAFKF